MSIHETIISRRTAHFYKTDPVPEGVLERAYEAAIRAPNHKLTNPWRFVEIGPIARAKLVDIVVELKHTKKPLSEAMEAKVRRKVGDSPVCVAVAQVLDPDEFRRKEDYAAVSCAIQNLTLSLWGEGISSKWSTSGAIHDDRTYALLEINSSTEEIVGIIFAGYADDSPDPPRRPVSDVVRRIP